MAEFEANDIGKIGADQIQIDNDLRKEGADLPSPFFNADVFIGSHYVKEYRWSQK